MEIKSWLEDDTLTVCITGEIDHHSAAGWRTSIDREAVCAHPAVLVMDFSGVTFMDSSGIGLVMGRYRLVRSWEGELLLTGLSDRLRKMMTLAGLDRLPVWGKKGEKKYETC
ncbi:MAG: STAS domain-containing protein [Clostridia bacterium]|nr:STAS domain-containing protein [Clostridia bacterium]